MSTPPRHIRIFLSSPGDVAEERTLALEVIDQLPYDPLLRGKVSFEVVAWDKRGSGTPMLATMTPQEAINRGLPKPSQCDIVVVIFWSRMGTPLPHPEYQKPNGEAYRSGTEWEYEDAMQAALHFKRPQVVIYRRQERIPLYPDDYDFDKKLEQWKRVEAFFKPFTDPNTGAILQGYNIYEKPTDFKRDCETHLKMLVKNLLEQSQDQTEEHKDLKPMPVSEPVTWKGSPFPGLRAFSPADAPIFFGRGRETDALVERVRSNRFVSVVGASGSGKSSLVGAGLIPRLRGNAIVGSKDWLLPDWQGGQWVGPRLLPGELGDNPLMALFARLAPLVGVAPRELAANIEGNPAHLQEAIDKALVERPEWSELLIFIDQFEELFTVVNLGQREKFFEILVRLAAIPRIRIVLTIRSDFYHRCVDIPFLAEFFENGSFPLTVPKRDILRVMIERPAERAGLTFENGLVDQILDDTGYEPGALALMAFALDELYKSRTNDGQLTHEAYMNLGQVEGAIGRRAEKVFIALDEEAQAALPHVFRRLLVVNLEGVPTRSRALLDDVSVNEGAQRLINALGHPEARLLIQDYDAYGNPTIEVAHEALFRSWGALANWIARVKDDLYLERQFRNAALEWRLNGYSVAFRWPQARLQAVFELIQRWSIDLDTDFNETEKLFLTLEEGDVAFVLNDRRTTHFQRATIGAQLATTRDSRPGVGLRADGVPDIAWCFMREGEIQLKTGSIRLKPFYIARFPVTFVQYRTFVEAVDGYHNPDWWDGLTQLSQQGTQFNQYDNHPAEMVNWNDAIAYCRWLSSRLEHEIRLPTEWEWLWAVTEGNPKRTYPWGNEWDDLKSNTCESELGRTVAVGMYSAESVDTGNVHEWCSNDLELSNDGAKVLRGGSWRSGRVIARTAFRGQEDPLRRLDTIGFRLCTSNLKLEAERSI